MVPSPAAASSSESAVQQSVFEGLFHHVLAVPAEGPLADALRGVGYDRRREERAYPARVWKDALDVTCAQLFPELPREEALRGLGVRFIEGFLKTLAGRALGIVLPMLGPDGALRRLQRFMAMGVPALRVLAYEDQPHSWRVEVHSTWAMADFDAGLIQAGVQRTGVHVRVDVLEREEHRYLLRVSW